MMVQVLVLMGMLFLSIGVLGLLKLPGTLERMHATSEATTLGVGFTTLATVVEFYPEGASLSAVLALVFLFLTAPTGAHMIARAKVSKEESEDAKKTGLQKFTDS